MTLVDKIARYQELLAKKAALAEETKANNKEIEEMINDISEQMIDDEVPSIGLGDYVFSLQEKTRYSKRSDADLMADGLDFFEVLREQGLGDLIREHVDARTFSSAVRNLVEENDGELPEELEAVTSTYTYYDISRRKAPSRALRSAKGGAL